VTLDSSAILAILFAEPGSELIVAKLRAARMLAIGAPTLFEAQLVAARRHDLRGVSLVSQFVERWRIGVVSFDSRHGRAATDAYVRFGKGRHPARLNYGDCMTYAIARVADLPLLFVGDDFAKTDIAAA
jgi:ribonuclease VapC